LTTAGPFRVILINVAVCLALALVAEAVFGSWFSDSSYGSLNLPRNVTSYYDTSGLYAGGGKVRYSRDEHGLRGDYTDPSRIDILTIGGSTTNQLYVDDEQTWQAHLRRFLAAAGHPAVVVNAAVDGQSTRGHIALFDRWFPSIPNLHARWILAYVGINDTAVDGAEQWDQMESPEPSRRLRYWILNNSALYNLFRTARGMFKAYNAKLVHGTPIYDGQTWERFLPVGESPPAASRAADLAAFEDRLRRLVRRIREAGAEAILVSQPTAEFRIRDGWVWVVRQPNGVLDSGGYETMAAFNRVTMTVCRELEAICLDLAAAVAFGDGDFYDRLHNTPQGTEKIGRHLADRLQEHLAPSPLVAR